MPDKNITIAVVAPREPFEFFDLVWEGVWSAAYELAPLGVAVRTVSTDSISVDEQRSALEELLAERVHALVMLPTHRTCLNDLIEKHSAQGTAVVTFLEDAPHSGRAAFVGPDADRTGRLAGDLLGRMISRGGRVAALSGPRGTFCFERRFTAFREALLQGNPDAVIQYFADADAADAAAKCAEGLFDGIYVGSSLTVDLGAFFAVAPRGIPCVGFQDTETVRGLLMDGRFAAIIDENRYHQSYMAVQNAYARARQEPSDKDWIRVPSSIVLASSIDDDTSHSLTNEFEELVRHRTSQLRNYREALEAANEKLQEQAVTDSLTGLLNRRRFDEVLALETSCCNDGSPLCLLVADVDDFKNVNDGHGHPAGDEVLRRVAEVLRQTCTPGAMAFRTGGDEFCAVMPGMSLSEAESLRTRLERGIAGIRLEQYQAISVSASFGIGILPRDGSTPDELFAAADRDLYNRKRAKPHRERRTTSAR